MAAMSSILIRVGGRLRRVSNRMCEDVVYNEMCRVSGTDLCADPGSRLSVREKNHNWTVLHSDVLLGPSHLVRFYYVLYRHIALTHARPRVFKSGMKCLRSTWAS